MQRYSKYEKETIILTSEGDKTFSVYTFNAKLMKKFKVFAEKYPECCQRVEMKGSHPDSMTFVIDKPRLSLRLNAPQSEDRKRRASEMAKQRGINAKK